MQYARPTSLLEAGGWIGTVGAVADSGGVDDATALVSPLAPSAVALVKMSLGAVSDPVLGAPTLRVRFAKNAAAGDPLTLWVELRQAPSGALIAQREVSANVGSSVSEWADALSPAEIASITNYGALEVWVWSTTEVVSVPGEFIVTIILEATGYRAIAASASGEALTSGTFVLPVVGEYDVLFTDLAGTYRTVTVSAGEVTHATAVEPPFPVVGGMLSVTITTTAVDAVVTVN